MGGVVSEIGELGQGVIDTVSDVGVSIDQGVRDTLGPNGWTLAALMAAGYYYAPEIGAYVNSTTGSTVPASAVVDAGASEAALTATDLAIGGGGGAVNAGFTLPAIPPEVSAVSNANSVVNAVSGNAAAVPTAVTPSAVTPTGELTAQQVNEIVNKDQAASTGLLGSVGSALGNLSTAQQIGLGAAALGATGAIGGSTPSSSTTTSSIDPDVKAAYLRNLEEARATAAGLGQRQFAPMTEYNLGMVQRYMNPYEQEVIQGSLGDIERARQGQISAEGARATAARAFGGSRQGVTRSLVDEAALRDVANLTSRLRSQGFTQAQNLGLAQEDLRRQLEQQRLDAARGLGVERLNVAQGALSLQPARIGESTTKPIYTNPVASGFGGALGGAQLGSLIGGKESGSEYAAYGAGLGGLLGFLG